MSKSSRRYMPARQGNDCVRQLRSIVRPPLLLCLVGVLMVALVLAFYLSNVADVNHRMPTGDLTKDKWSHKPTKYSAAQIHRLASQVDVNRLWETHLRPILIERLPGTQGSLAVREHITSAISSLSAGWDIDLDTFKAATPRGQVTFTNIIATLDPSAPRRLLLTCHYDSKALPPDSRGRVFLGASDSAVPCAMILELATALDNQMKSYKREKVAVTPQLVFFDGEESFEKWTATDSLYGSRHLAKRMAAMPHPADSSHSTLLQAVDLFVLLDLLGAPDPLIVNHFDNTARWFDRLIATEKRLHRQGLLTSHPSEQTYFRKDLSFGTVEDDHIPFLRRGVPVLHVIATPFPNVWHTLDDSEENLHRPTVDNLTKILAVFLAEYLGF
ncbi:glutaminyl-peptide cyclotransferase-like a [Syngnathoides biaculeatus]|uniref:glutaminyl-peptide cyclotransferase-like a n=1 Tax=Syngnathoides biaculeatus TaxID=300417 RepID=UPI002ADD5E57|nr:glutaminyl-peptide cyclotransferase-like a [Syngnathoides biaculeatus]XP_061682404.1 glutaminyl-peptide cyclotransferase-like a [Syngnathoides biaculeatus]XP_061682405.1 glutaminyl-peptide cyclotransferase-like a [Syngnathoides biaculeatus]XP_061682406.1 glutaminyl-peptide cyclotransferase-like a [Syngnathoides biaculeatus]